MEVTTSIKGSCHCGNIRYEFRPVQAPADLPVRACRCTFCRKHDARYTSDPGGRLTLTIGSETQTARYRFATRTAEFVVCRNCGVLVAVLAEISGRTHAVVNLAAADGFDLDQYEAKAADFSGESESQRRARRGRNWIADVTVVVEA